MQEHIVEKVLCLHSVVKVKKNQSTGPADNIDCGKCCIHLLLN